MWRSFGPESELTAIYATGIQEQLPDNGLCSLALDGNNKIRQYGGIYPALAGIHESEMRHLVPKIDYAHAHREFSPAPYPAAVGILDQGVLDEYSNGVGRSPSARTTSQSCAENQFRFDSGETAEGCDGTTAVRVLHSVDFARYPRLMLPRQ